MGNSGNRSQGKMSSHNKVHWRRNMMSEEDFATDMEQIFESLPENIKEEIEKGLEDV